MEYIKTILTNLRVRDVIDISIVAFAYYKLYMIIRETRAKQLLKGIMFIFIISALASALKLFTISWIITNTLQVGFIALVIVFQPELRKALEYIGRTTLLSFNVFEGDEKRNERTIKEIMMAVHALANQRIGALIIFELKTGLSDIMESGVAMDAHISNGLLINIFIPNTPLHDGAVIIKNYSIKAAGCFLPLTESQHLSKDIGTRHRAAIGVTERSDSIALIVSEETGYISYAHEGRLYRNIQSEELTELLTSIYKKDEKQTIFERWWHRDGKKQG